MIKPMTKWQKIFAYSTLALVIVWTVLGIFAICVILLDKF